MLTHVDKNPKNKSKSVANTVSQQKTDSKANPQFVDNRPEAVQMRKLQDIANNSPYVNQAVQLQSFANNDVIQRMYNFEGMTYSENALYGIKDSDSTKLYTDKNAKGPSPNTFFEIVNEEKRNYGIIPITDELLEMGGEKSKEKAYYSKKFNVFSPKAEFTKGEPKHNELKGINDCGAYACALNTNNPKDWDPRSAADLFKRPKADYQPDGIDGADKDDSVSADVGETYLIQWQGEKEEGKAVHHAATTVAKDGNDHVTSEAHIGKQELQKPEFHMYGTKKDSFYNKHKDYFTKKDGPAPYMAIIGSQKK